MSLGSNGRTSPMGKREKPRDCAIAVCIPLDAETFVHSFNFGGEGSFVRDNDRPENRLLTPLQRWDRYKPLAILFERVLVHVERLGVRVVRHASFTQFRELCSSSCTVVSLVAHWRSARFRAGDIVNSADLVALMRSNASLQRLLSELCGEINFEDDPVKMLNQALGIPARTEEIQSPGVHTSKQITWYQRRKLIESAAPTQFQGGAAVEFSDGLQLLPDILASLPETMPPLLDLTVCNSVLLAQMISDAHSSTHCLCNEDEARLDIRIAFYRMVIDQLARKDTSFLDASFDIRKYF